MLISLVIPCRNEVQYIEECIRAIYQSKIDSTYTLNVFVVDGMSDDGTRELVQKLRGSEFPSLNLIDNVAQLTPYAFNLGIHAQTCDFVQIVGARHILSDNYLQTCLDVLQGDPSIWCVGGKIINEYVNDEGRIISAAMSTSFGMGLGNFRTLEKSGFTDTVTSPMYPVAVFEKIGFFDEELIRNQDDDFNYRVTHAGGKIYFSAEISLRYYVRGNFKSLYRQFYQYGYWKVYVNQKHRAVTTLRQLVPPLFVFYLIVLVISNAVLIGLRDTFPEGVIISNLLQIPFCLYILLNLLSAYRLLPSLNERMPKAYFSFLKLCWTYLILHFAYGLGYLKGIVDFLLFKKKPSDKHKRLSR